jgi:hypothetical protein
MIILMNGWMLFFMSIYYKDKIPGLIGLLFITIGLVCIRTQFMVSDIQYILGMIPHHSMAIHMSRQLLKRPHTNLSQFANRIIESQEDEILCMKRYISN